MNFDSVTVFFAFMIATLSYVAFIYTSRRSEMNYMREQLSPVIKQIQQTIAQNYLSNSNIPTKSEIISLLSGIARKKDIKLLSHYPMHQLIDDLIYGVISNPYLDQQKKDTLSQSLMQLKTKPMLSEDYVYLVAELEKEDNSQSRWAIQNYTQALITTSVLVVIASMPVLQFGESLSRSMVVFFDLTVFTLTTFAAYLVIGAVSSLVSGWYIKQQRTAKAQNSKNSLLNLNKISLANIKKSPLTNIINLNTTKIEKKTDNNIQEQATESNNTQNETVQNLQEQNQEAMARIQN